MSTIFTKIINREIPADIVYEDDLVIAFLDINPIRKGHTLVVPKQCFENIFDGDEASLSRMMIVAQKIARAVLKATSATGINLHMNNGHNAGQDVPHAHIHIVPRTKRGEAFICPEHATYTPEERASLARTVQAYVQES